MRRALVAVATALLVVTAGCAATPGTGTPAADGGDAGGGSDGAMSGDDATAADSGTVNFYVSDRPNDMDDFKHLNVTIATVKFHLVDAADNGSAADEETATTTATAAGNETEADDADANETVVDEETEKREDDADDEEREDGEREAEGDDDDEGEDDRWVTREVNATSVDLSELRGANVTLLEQFDLPAGEYDTVHMEVSEIDATLTNGDDQRVKLPSNKLQLNTEFTVANGSEVDFVYDVSVHKAGKSGKYILKPVVSESGTDVAIDRVDDEDERENEGKDDERENEREDEERSLDASFLGNVTTGETVTVQVTENGSVVANATVLVDGEEVGTTDANGEYVVSVPSDAEELKVEIQDGDAEAELEAEFEGGEGEGEAGDGGDAQSVGA